MVVSLLEQVLLTSFASRVRSENRKRDSEPSLLQSLGRRLQLHGRNGTKALRPLVQMRLEPNRRPKTFQLSGVTFTASAALQRYLGDRKPLWPYRKPTAYRGPAVKNKL
jgi:hypothetical protein